MADPRRAGPLASLSVLGAGAGWGALTGTAAGGLSVVVSADDPGLADLPGALGLALLFGAPAGAALGLALALLPAVTVACVRSTRRARVVAAGACAPGAVLVVVAQFNDGVDGQEAEALVFATAALFGVWRCQRSAAVAVERVARWRAAPRVPPPGIPLEEPSRQPGRA